MRGAGSWLVAGWRAYSSCFKMLSAEVTANLYQMTYKHRRSAASHAHEARQRCKSVIGVGV